MARHPCADRRGSGDRVNENPLVFEAALRAQRGGRAAALATVIDAQGSVPRQAGSKMLVWPDGNIVGTVGGGAMEALVIEEAQAALLDGATRTRTYELTDLAAGDPGICGGTVQVFIEPLAPPPMLLVIGCGHVGKALAELAKWMEFRVVVSDDRPGFATEAAIPGMDGYLAVPPAELPAQITFGPQTYVAAVTRGLPVDEKLIPALLATDAAYIGLIGSRRRWALTRKALLAAGIAEASLARVHAPIGLELQAETPKEIAVSIMAQVVMIQRGGTGASMAAASPSDGA